MIMKCVIVDENFHFPPDPSRALEIFSYHVLSSSPLLSPLSKAARSSTLPSSTSSTSSTRNLDDDRFSFSAGGPFSPVSTEAVGARWVAQATNRVRDRQPEGDDTATRQCFINRFR